MPKSSSSCQNLTSDTPDPLSGVIRSCILSCSGALAILNSKLFIMRFYDKNLPFYPHQGIRKKIQAVQREKKKEVKAICLFSENSRTRVIFCPFFHLTELAMC